MTISDLTLAAFLTCFLLSIEPFGSTGFNIKLIPIDRFDTILFPKNLTLEERSYRMLEISRARVHQLEFAASLSSGSRKVPAEHGPSTLRPKTTLHAGYYITTMTIGTPPFTVFLVVSTASDDTWTQCEGCTNCFPLRQGNFNRRLSITYRPLPHDHPLCLPRIVLNGSCMYDATGFSHGCFNCYSKGQIGLDTFVFPDGARSAKFLGTAFGCGLDNYNLGWANSGQNNIISGVFGLGLGRRSLFSQYGNVTKGRLSYCLPSIFSPNGTYTFLQFGDEASIGEHPGAVVRTTPLVPNVTQYAITVTGISINEKYLNINPEVFRMRPDHTGGFVLDTGLPYTTLVHSAYAVVKEELRQYFSNRYGWHPRTPQPGRFDLCYDLPHGDYAFPFMVFHLAGADLFLNKKHLFHFFSGGFCLLIMPINDRGINILGATQQANYQFLFDFRSHTLSFAYKECRFH